MSAATCPTSFLSTPWIVIFVLSATVILMFSGIENRTGCEKPRLKLRIGPCTAALKPTPSISSCLAKPSLTPCTILCTRLRESPCNAFALRVSASRPTDTRLPSTLARILRGSFHWSFPLGPSTETAPSLSTLTLTLSGISTALFPIRDIEFTKRRQVLRRPPFAFSLRAPIKHRAKWKESPDPFHQELAGFHLRQRNGVIPGGSPGATLQRRSIGPQFC